MRTQVIRSRENPNLELIAFHGHFATRHSHNSHYLDITRLKHEYSLAHDTALALANHYIYEKSIDTIICMDGSEVIGAFLARQLTQKILFSANNRKECASADFHSQFRQNCATRPGMHPILWRQNSGHCGGF